MKSFFKYIKEEVSLFGKLFFGIIFIFLLLSAVIMPAVAVYMLSTAIIAFSFYCCITWFCIKNSENKTDDAAKAVVPKDAQTGPAVRYDENVLRAQGALLKSNPQMKDIYDRMSMSIHKLSVSRLASLFSLSSMI